MPRLGYLLPTRERVMEGRDETGSLLSLAERAEGLGFDSLWVGGSLLARPRHDPLTLLAAVAAVAAVAARTRRAELGTAVLLPALRNPVVLAQQVATLDRIAEGRLVLGVGIATDVPNIRAEFIAAGVPFDKRVGRLVEGLALCRALWTGKRVTWPRPGTEGRWTMTDAVLGPTPHRPGGPPIWIAGAVPVSRARAGRRFDGWFPNSAQPQDYPTQFAEVTAAARDAGRDPAAITAAAYLTLSIDDDAGRADQRLNAYLQGYYSMDPRATRKRQMSFAGPAAPRPSGWPPTRRQGRRIWCCASPAITSATSRRSPTCVESWVGETMKFSLHFASNTFPDFAGAARVARAAEAAGFDSIFAIDHVVYPDAYTTPYPYAAGGRLPMTRSSAFPDPLIWIASAAAVTTRLRFMTGVLILPLRDPLVLAKQVATLDAMSGGRFELGIGVGWLREEFEALGAPFEQRGRRADEYIAAMRALWASDGASFSGRYVKFEGVSCNPKPVGRVPIVIGGHSEAAARRAGRLGDGFFPSIGAQVDTTPLFEVARRASVEVGRDPAAIEMLAGCPDLLPGSTVEPRAAIEERLKLGIGRIVVPVGSFLPDLEDNLSRFGDAVIRPFADLA